MRPLDELRDSPNFTLYQDSSLSPLGFSDLYSSILMKTTRGYNNILVERHYKDDVYLYMWVNNCLMSTDYFADMDDSAIYPDEYSLLSFDKSSLEATYYVIGYWNY